MAEKIKVAEVTVPLSIEPVKSTIDNANQILNEFAKNKQITQGIKAQLQAGAKLAQDFQNKVANLDPNDPIDVKELEKLQKEAKKTEDSLRTIAEAAAKSFKENPIPLEYVKKLHDIQDAIKGTKEAIKATETDLKDINKVKGISKEEMGAAGFDMRKTKLETLRPEINEKRAENQSERRKISAEITALRKKGTVDDTATERIKQIEQEKDALLELESLTEAQTTQLIALEKEEKKLTNINNFTPEDIERLNSLIAQKDELLEINKKQLAIDKIVKAQEAERDALLEKRDKLGIQLNEQEKARLLQLEENTRVEAENKEAVERTRSAYEVYKSAVSAFRKEGDNLIKQQQKHAEQMNKLSTSVNSAVTRFIGFRAIFNQLRGIIKDGIQVIKELDKAFTETAMVTTYSRKQAWELKDAYTGLALQTGLTTVEVAKMGTEFFRQGRALSEVIKLTEAAGIAAKIAGISTSESIRYLTSAVNGYGLAADQAIVVSDKFASLAATSATDYEELAIALSKVAAQAHSAGVGMDSMLGFIAKALEVTREAPENIGTAFKTIFARMQELKDYGKTLEDGMDVNRIDKALGSIGIKLTDQAGELRALDTVLMEVGAKWKTLDKNQKAYVATALAGTRQQTRLLAVFEDFDRTMELVEASSNSLGASYAQQYKYYGSIEYAQQKLATSWQQFVSNTVSSDAFIVFNNALIELVQTLNSAATAFDGWGTVVLAITLPAMALLLKTTISNILAMTAKISLEKTEIAMLKTKKKEYEQILKIEGIRFASSLNEIQITNFKTLSEEAYVKSLNDQQKAQWEAMSAEQKGVVLDYLTVTSTLAKTSATEAGTVATTKEIIVQQLKEFWLKIVNAQIWKQVAAQLAMVSSVLAVVAVFALLVVGFIALNRAFRKAEIEQQNFIDGQKRLQASIYNTNKSIREVGDLADEYKKLSNQLNKTSQDYERMDSIIQQINDSIAASDEKYKNINVAPLGELNEDFITAWTEEQTNKMNAAWEDVFEGILGRYGSFAEAFKDKSQPLIQAQAELGEAFRLAALDDARIKTMDDFTKLPIELQKMYKTMAKTTIEMEVDTLINGVKWDPKNPKELTKESRAMFDAINKETIRQGEGTAIAAGATVGAGIGAMLAPITAGASLVFAPLVGAGVGAITELFDRVGELSAEFVAEEYSLFLENKDKYTEFDPINLDTWHWPWSKSQRDKLAEDFEKLQITLKEQETKINADVKKFAKELAETDIGSNLVGTQFAILEQMGFYASDVSDEARKKIIDTVPEVETLMKVQELLGDSFDDLKYKLDLSVSAMQKYKDQIYNSNFIPEDLKNQVFKDLIIDGPVNAFNKLKASEEGAKLTTIELINIANELAEAMSPETIETLNDELTRYRSIGTGLESVNKMLSGDDIYDMSKMQEYLELYPEIVDAIREEGYVSEDVAKIVKAADKDKLKNKLLTERASLQTQLENTELQLDALKAYINTDGTLTELGAKEEVAITEDKYNDLLELQLDYLRKAAADRGDTAEVARLDARIAQFKATTQDAGAAASFFKGKLDSLTSTAQNLRARILNIDLALMNLEDTLDESGEAIDLYISKITRISILQDGIDDLANSLSLLQAVSENLNGSDLIENLDAQRENIETTNTALIDQNIAIQDRQNYILNGTSEASKLLRENTEIVDGQIRVKESFLDLNGDEMEMVESLINEYDDLSDQYNENEISIQNNIKALEELERARLETIDTTKQLVIEAIKSEYTTRATYAEKAYEEERKWLEKRKALYEEAFNVEEFDKTLAELEKRRAENILQISKMEGTSNTVKYRELMDEKASIDEEYSDLMNERSQEALLNSLEMESTRLESEAEATALYYEEKINNITELEARAVQIINSGVDQTLAYLQANSDDFKNATAEAKQLMLDEWSDLVTQTKTYFDQLIPDTPDLSGWINQLDALARAFGNAAANAARLGNNSGGGYTPPPTKNTADYGSLGNGSSTNPMFGQYGDMFWAGNTSRETILQAVQKTMSDTLKDYNLYLQYKSQWDLERSRVIKMPSGKWTSGLDGVEYATQEAAMTYLKSHSDAWTSMNRVEPTALRYVSAKKTYDDMMAGKYKKGGLASKTGFAWLDGTANKPERVLSPVQTSLFEDMVKALEIKANALTSTSPQLAAAADSSISIGQIVIQTPQLNNTQDFTAAGTELAKAFRQAIAQRGVNINKKI